MSFTRFLLIAIMSAAAAAASQSYAAESAPAAAAPASPAASAPVTHAELPALVKQAILDNPDIIMEAAQKLRDKQMADASKQAETAIKQHHADLFSDPNAPSVGNKNGVTVVEFFDYHCGYCKHMLPAITQLVKEDKNVHVIFKEFPILSEDSVTAARAALAVYHIAPDKYFDYYTALLKSNGKFDDDFLLGTAKKLGISASKLKAEMDKPSITAELDKNRDLGKDLGVRGTPALIIGGHFVPGAITYEDLKKEVDEARNGKSESPKG